MLRVLLLGVGVALLLLAVATLIPALGVIGIAYLLGGGLYRRRASDNRTVLGTIGGLLASALGTLLVVGIGVLWLRARPPAPDPFYAFTSAVPNQPGVLLRAEPFTRVVPAHTRVWRILYSTTRADDAPAIASAIVLAPAQQTPDPRPVIAWAHGTTGVAQECAPTVLPAPFPFDETLPALEQLIAKQWVLVGTDYVGLGTGGGHPYLIGEPAGRSTLDAVRAARQLAEVKLDGRTVVWGHSQGGHAALWTGILAPRYAPDVDVAGIAAIAPATDLGSLVDAAQHTTAGTIMGSFVMTAYSQAYGDVRFEDYVGPRSRTRAMASRCLSGPGALLSLLTSLTMERPFLVRPPIGGALGRRLQENVPTALVTSPLLIAQGLADGLVLPDIQERFVRGRCDAGQDLEYRTYSGWGHLSVVAPDSPLVGDLVVWTADRFSGRPVERGCMTISR